MTTAALYMRCFKRAFLPLHRTFQRLVFISSLFIAAVFIYHYMTVFDRKNTTVAFFQETITPKQTQNLTRYSILEPYIVPNNVPNTYLLVIVSSSARGEQHVHRREAIRNTWGKYSVEIAKKYKVPEFSWRVVFMMGKSPNKTENTRLEAEANLKGDLIVGDYHDVYKNITVKLLMTFKWATNEQFKYLLKTDDDVYINIPQLLLWVQHPNLPSRLYAGVKYKGIVVRDVTHRHYISVNDFAPAYYPSYVKGAMYVVSATVLKEMVHMAYTIKRIGVDDAYVGILANEIGVKPYHMSRFVQKEFSSLFVEQLNGCQFREILGIGDGLSGYQLEYLHHKVHILQETSDWFCLKIHPSNGVIITSSVVIVLLVVWLACCRKSKGTSSMNVVKPKLLQE